jgi:2-polyprenyl-3-methyl-5-hydroxy-6-metoxy-1,4-benzoquinol methylase
LNPANNIGKKTLEVISKANRFNRWMYDTIRPYCYGNVLEIGSGTGNISSFFIEDGFQITLSDIGEHYLQILKKKFGGIANVKDILLLDLEQHDFQNVYKEKENFFDTIYLLNVLEHIEEHGKAVQNCKYLLREGGTLIILVPAYSWLFSKLDKELNHYRRYTLNKLNRLLAENQISVKKQFYFNALGIAAWAYGKIFRLSLIPAREMKMFNKIVPIAKMIDRIFFRSTGLSAIIIGMK